MRFNNPTRTSISFNPSLRENVRDPMVGDNTPAPPSSNGGGGGGGGNVTLGSTGTWRYIEIIASGYACLVLQHKRSDGVWYTVNVYQDATVA